MSSARLLKSSFVTEPYVTMMENDVMRDLDLYGYGKFKVNRV